MLVLLFGDFMQPITILAALPLSIGGAIVGITAVLVAVFVPMAFFSGAVGNIYR